MTFMLDSFSKLSPDPRSKSIDLKAKLLILFLQGLFLQELLPLYLKVEFKNNFKACDFE